MNPHVVHATIDCQSARQVLAGLVTHPQHRFVADSPPLTADSFDALAPQIRGYKQMTDATLFRLAHVHGMKLVTFDQSLVSLSPWPQDVEVLVG